MLYVQIICVKFGGDYLPCKVPVFCVSQPCFLEGFGGTRFFLTHKRSDVLVIQSDGYT